MCDCGDMRSHHYKFVPIEEVMKMTTISLYLFSLVGRWHQNSFCMGMEVIKTIQVSVDEFVAMEEKGEICRRCKRGYRRY